MEDQIYITQVLEGRTEAFSVLVDRYKDLAYTIALRVARNTEDAEEIAQDGFLKAYNQLHTFKGSAKFSTWLYAIVYRTAISKMRKKKLDVVDVDDYVFEQQGSVTEAPQLEELTAEERKRYISQALKRLPELDALLISLYYIHERSIDEIQEITRLTESNVKVKLHRGRKQLYNELSQLLNHEMETIR